MANLVPQLLAGRTVGVQTGQTRGFIAKTAARVSAQQRTTAHARINLRWSNLQKHSQINVERRDSRSHTVTDDSRLASNLRNGLWNNPKSFQKLCK